MGLGADFALPTGELGDFYDVGFGSSLQLQVPITNKLAFVASAGYLNLQGKNGVQTQVPSLVIDVPNYDAIPVKAGLRYFLIDNFYVGAEAGAGFDLRNKTDDDESSSTSFIYTPHIGIDFPVSDKGSIDLSARYETWKAKDEPSARFFGLRVAYNFAL